MLLKLCGNVKT